MEGSCRATPRLLTRRNSKSSLQVASSHDSPASEGMLSPSKNSVDPVCAICLEKFQNKSFPDSCLHQFCYQCLLQWSKIKSECPLCKKPFKSIIRNVRSNLDHGQYQRKRGKSRHAPTDLMHSDNFDLIPVHSRLRELAERPLASARRLPEDSCPINFVELLDPAPASNHHLNYLYGTSTKQRRRQRATIDFRLNVYTQNLWVQDMTDISGRYNKCTPEFFRENPAQIHRIIPWLKREIKALLNNGKVHVGYVLSQIVFYLTKHPIRSRQFRKRVRSYFGARADHFIHEFYIFARTGYSVVGFDRNAVYAVHDGSNHHYATEVTEISSSSDSDSDIEMIEIVTKSNKSRRGLKKLPLKRAARAEPKSEEPVAGPSGIASTKICNWTEIGESDSEEHNVLDDETPKPEVITLSSDKETPTYSVLSTSDGEYTEARSSLHKNDGKKCRSRSAKGKCKSNGFGLKGIQKRK